jgi:hypothetical protein
VKVGYGECVAPANSTGSDDSVANSGDGGGGSNGEESEREMKASSGREKGERRSLVFIEEREGEGGVDRGSSWASVGLQVPSMAPTVSSRHQWWEEEWREKETTTLMLQNAGDKTATGTILGADV